MAAGTSVPVAANLLDTKFLGVSVRRLLGSMAIPLTPCLIVYTLGFPFLVTLPLFLAGLAIGGTIFRKTPTGQQPLPYTVAIIKHRLGSNTYTWQSPVADPEDLSTGEPLDVWLTLDAPPGQPPTAKDPTQATPPGATGVPHDEFVGLLSATQPTAPGEPPRGDEQRRHDHPDTHQPHRESDAQPTPPDGGPSG